MLRVLALDHGTRLGWACGSVDRLPALGHRLNPHPGGDEQLEPMWVAHKKWLEGVITDFKPTLIAWEKPILPENTSLASLEILLGLQAISGLTARLARVPVRTATVQQAKIALACKGNAVKDEMVKAARQLYGYKIAVPDEADALGVWLHVVRILAPAHAHRFDPLFSNLEG